MNTIKSSVKSAVLSVLSGFSTFAHNTIITTVKLNKKNIINHRKCLSRSRDDKRTDKLRQIKQKEKSMKVLVNGNDLSNAVMKVSKAISVKTTNPILEGIKMTVKGDEMTLAATDMEIAIEKTIRSDTIEEGTFVIPGKLFAEFTKKLEGEDQVELMIGDDNKLKIIYGSSEVYLSTLPADQFPAIKKDLREKAFSILQKDFKDIINKTVFSCSTDESRPILKGELFSVKDNELTCVALDGFRLAVAKKKLRNSTSDFKLVVPARAVAEISRLLDKDEEEITFVSEEKSLMIEVDGTVFITRLLEGEFINYEQIIPKEFLTTVRVNRIAFLNSLERASVVAKENKNLIKLDIKDNNINVLSNSESGNVNENVIVNLDGKDVNIAFNSKYLCDALKAAGDEFVNINMNSSISPCIIRPYSGEEYLYLILPIRINS